MLLNSSGYKKNNNQRSSVSPIYDFGQQRLNGTADWSALEGGQVLPHFKHIASGALMLPCPIVAVFQFLCGWLVGPLVVGRSTIRVAGL
jgi:hypothetical protein